MRITVVTLFPDYFKSVLKVSILGRAIVKKKIRATFVNPRDFATDKHRSVDDTPYGGGAGMVLRPDVYFAAIEKSRTKGSKVILLTPQGKKFDQNKAVLFSKERALVLVCGHYEGFDERIRSFVDEEISLGDFVLTGGEAAAAAIVDAVARLVKGVLPKEESASVESFSTLGESVLLEYPQYTRPLSFRGLRVPAVLLSGNHKKIADWRREQAQKRTKQRRPELA